MKNTTIGTLVLLLAALCASAQTASFTFGPINPPPFPQQTCGPATFDDGQNGSICLAIYPYGYTNLYAPHAYGFPNDGALTQCATTPNQLGFGTPGFVDNGDGTGSQKFTANSCYDGGNTTISATVLFKRVSHLTCGRSGCHTTYSWVVNGGSGSAVN